MACDYTFPANLDTWLFSGVAQSILSGNRYASPFVAFSRSYKPSFTSTDASIQTCVYRPTIDTPKPIIRSGKRRCRRAGRGNRGLNGLDTQTPSPFMKQGQPGSDQLGHSLDVNQNVYIRSRNEIRLVCQSARRKARK
jgi:hypothetical protein